MVCFLVSTMNCEDTNQLIENMNIRNNYIVVNQVDSISTTKSKDSSGLIINSNTIGLSKSRNIALENTNDSIVVLSDDDLIYLDDAKNNIENAFNENPDYHVIAFVVEGIEKKFKNYPNKPKKIGFLTSMKVSSVQIAIRRSFLTSNKIRFDEQFGAGSKYFLGEENILLFDILKKGGKIKFIPEKIADLHIGNSTWFKGYDAEYLIARGASYERMSGFFSNILIIQFALRKNKLYKEKFSFTDALKLMYQGKAQFRRQV